MTQASLPLASTRPDPGGSPLATFAAWAAGRSLSMAEAVSEALTG